MTWTIVIRKAKESVHKASDEILRLLQQLRPASEYIGLCGMQGRPRPHDCEYSRLREGSDEREGGRGHAPRSAPGNDPKRLGAGLGSFALLIEWSLCINLFNQHWSAVHCFAKRSVRRRIPETVSVHVRISSQLPSAPRVIWSLLTCSKVEFYLFSAIHTLSSTGLLPE